MVTFPETESSYPRPPIVEVLPRRHLCRQGVALASTQQLRSQGPVSVQVHRTGGVTGSEGQEGANGVGAGLESGAGTETVTGSGVGSGT